MIVFSTMCGFMLCLVGRKSERELLCDESKVDENDFYKCSREASEGVDFNLLTFFVDSHEDSKSEKDKPRVEEPVELHCCGRLGERL